MALPGTSILPEALQSIRGKLGVTHRVLDVLVSGVVLQRARVMAVVSEFVAANATQNVRETKARSVRRRAGGRDFLSAHVDVSIPTGKCPKLAALCGAARCALADDANWSRMSWRVEHNEKVDEVLTHWSQIQAASEAIARMNAGSVLP